jgi:signal transduction histidine kinase
MKLFKAISRSNFLNSSLRVKIMLIFTLPMLFTISILSYIHSVRERTEFEKLTEITAVQLAGVLLDSLDHAMILNDQTMIMNTLHKVGGNPPVEQILIVASDATVFASTNPSMVGEKFELKEAGCVECHRYSKAERPHIMQLWLNKSILRVSTSIANAPECQACHPKSQEHLGVFLIDLSTAETETHVREDTMYNIALSSISIISVLFLAYLLTQWLIVRRVDVIREALTRLSNHDFSARIINNWRTQDEVTRLADNINTMAASFEILQSEHEQKEKVRAQAIIDERERIARELHDGVAQFLAYLSAKVGATRMALKNGKEDTADRNLENVEQAIREQSVEVRSAIIGLKMAGNVDKGFANNVREFIDQCNRLDDLALELEISKEVDNLELDVEKELQLFRILQEAVSNIRKHSMASEATIRLEMNKDQFVLTISDNGVGFDPVKTGVERAGHFGLRIMFERAREVGANVEIKSNPGLGTRVIVTLNIQES